MKSKLNTELIRLWTEPATREANDRLYPAVASGDEAAREQMIHSNMGLVISKVDHFLVFFPKFRHLRDDMISDGFVGLVEAVNRMANDGLVEDANPTGLMGVCIQSRLGKTIEADETIRIPARTKKRKKEQGINLETPEKLISIFHTDNDEDEIEEAFTYDPRRMQELRETLEACCENDAEREILRMREARFVDREIAEVLGIPLTTAYVMRRTMYARFLELTGWKGEA